MSCHICVQQVVIVRDLTKAGFMIRQPYPNYEGVGAAPTQVIHHQPTKKADHGLCYYHHKKYLKQFQNWNLTREERKAKMIHVRV